MKTIGLLFLLLVLGTGNVNAQNKEQKFFFNSKTILTISPQGQESNGPGNPQEFLVTLHSAEKILFSQKEMVNGPIYRVVYNGKNSIGIFFNTVKNNHYCIEKIYRKIVFGYNGYSLCEITKKDFTKEKREKIQFH